jgi:radical SAM superfamily enzyme YgiQ (UPF0313 family)
MPRTFSLDPSLYVTADTTVDRQYMDLMREQDQSPQSPSNTLPRFTFVVGPSPFTMPRGWEYYLTQPYEGVTTVATILHNAGYRVRIVDARYAKDPVAYAVKEVLAGTDVCGLATYEDSFPFQEQVIAALKEAAPKMPIFLGGSLVTSVPHLFMQHTAADVAVISEGELTLLELMEAFTRGELEKRLPEIRGIWYRDGKGQTFTTPARGQLLDMNCLPRLNVGLWPMAKDPRGVQPNLIVSHSRGCKMDCSFCFRTTPQLREKTPQKLREEVAHLVKTYGMNYFFFSDLTWTSDRKRTFELCEALQDFNVGWACMTRCADVDPEVLAAMKKAGCSIILFGVESLAAKVLKEARKGSHENLVIRTMHNTVNAGIRFGGLLIVGLPGETEEGLQHMCEWAEEYRHVTRVKYLSALPGTTIYYEGLKSGLIKNELEHLRWLALEQALERDEFLNCNGLPPAAMREAYRRCYAAYQPGPQMDYEHWPEHFEYFDPDPSEAWHEKFTSAAAPLMPGLDRYRMPELCNGVRFTPQAIIQLPSEAAVTV